MCIHRNVSPTEGGGGGGEENNSQKTQHKQARGKTQPLFASSPPRFPPPANLIDFAFPTTLYLFISLPPLSAHANFFSFFLKNFFLSAAAAGGEEEEEEEERWRVQK